MSATDADGGVLLSVVVPAHDVDEYVTQCLDSLLVDPSVDFELIVIDDGSTDRTGALLDARATEDHRVRVVHLEANCGSGAARNTGVDRATGEYVWFVDADDWVSAGAVGRVITALDGSDLDVLFVGHARVSATSVWRLDSDRLLAELPPTFTAAEQPGVFDLSPSPCNRIARRRLLIDHGLRFSSGAYEDIPVSLPLLAVAERMGALPQVCLFYRQRAGSTVQRAGDHHLDVLRQFDQVHGRLQDLGADDVVLSAAYEVMVRWFFDMLRSRRIEMVHRSTYLRQAHALLRRHRPPHHRSPSVVAATRRRLLCTRSASLIDVFCRLRSAVAMVQTAASRVRHAVARRRAARSLSHLWRRARQLAYYRWQRSRPIDPALALYCAYWGEQVAVCNPGAIFERARELAPSIHAVWAVTADRVRDVPTGVDAVVIGTRRYYWALARARYLVNNANFGDEFVKRRGTTFVQTHHGTPLKAMAIDVVGQRPDEATGLLRRCRAWDYSVSSNAHSTSVWRRTYPVPHRSLDVGYPRNDVLANAGVAETSKARAAVGIRDDQTAVLYAPTYRADSPDRLPLDPARLARALGSEHALMVRGHYFDAAPAVGASPIGDCHVLDASLHRVEQCYLAADVLITDYSSTMFDFAVLDRPIVVFAPDWERYVETRGVYFDLEACGPGLFVRDVDELGDVLRSGEFDGDRARRLRSDFRRRFCSWDDGDASTRVVQAVMPTETPPAPRGREDC